MNKFELAKAELQKSCTYVPNKNFDQLFCRLHDEEYLGSHSGSHACLACNLNNSLEKIHKFLKQNRSKEDIEYSFTIFILLTYLLVEKLTTVFKHIGITQEYVETKWPVLTEIRKWANFIKHPKGFLFAHHPEFLFEDDEIPIKYKNWKKVNYKNLVEPLYKREDEGKYKQSINEFANRFELLVLIPNPERIAKELNLACFDFCEKIKDNSHFKEILKETSVIDYIDDSVV